jgi:hypothetical protein
MTKVKVPSDRGRIVGVFALVWLDLVGLIGIVVVCGGMYYLSTRIEPHWVAKDQSRFLTVAQELDHHGLPLGRRRDVRVNFDPGGEALLVSRRSWMRPTPARWTVKSKSTTGRGRFVYVLRPVEKIGDIALLALRVPQRSKAVPRLDELLELTGDEASMRRERDRYRAEQQTTGDATGASGTPGSPPPDQQGDLD